MTDKSQIAQGASTLSFSLFEQIEVNEANNNCTISGQLFARLIFSRLY